jgi:hypothetical protein
MSSIPLTAKGPAQICIFDIHVLQERFYFYCKPVAIWPSVSTLYYKVIHS